MPVGKTGRDDVLAAAAAIGECRRELAQRRRTILDEVLSGGELAEWRHYPPGEAYDPQSHAQYFYHAHPLPGRAAAEHGHFHTFLRAEGMPPGVVPLLLPEAAVANAPAPQGAPLKRGGRDEVSHLVAIAIDLRGEPIRLFTTNRWVTGETWYPAADVIAMLDRFRLAGETLLDRWLEALLRLFRPQIVMLLRQRDRRVMEWRQRRRAAAFEDIRLEIPSACDIDLDAQLASLDAPPARRPRPRSLPAMAEGWGEG